MTIEEYEEMKLKEWSSAKESSPWKLCKDCGIRVSNQNAACPDPNCGSTSFRPSPEKIERAVQEAEQKIDEFEKTVAKSAKDVGKVLAKVRDAFKEETGSERGFTKWAVEKWGKSRITIWRCLRAHDKDLDDPADIWGHVLKEPGKGTELLAKEQDDEVLFNIKLITNNPNAIELLEKLKNLENIRIARFEVKKDFDPVPVRKKEKVTCEICGEEITSKYKYNLCTKHREDIEGQGKEKARQMLTQYMR